MPEPKPSKPTVLVQLDTDEHPSVFDAMVAVDSGVDHLFRHGNIRRDQVRDLVHGVLFTRGGADLRRSAIFVGGSDVAAGETILQAVVESFFGPFRVSVLIDSKGANTTAAATALAIRQSLPDPASWQGESVAILGAGPVGQKVARLLARLGAQVRIGAPDLDLAIAGVESFPMEPDWQAKIAHSTVIVAAGPAGVEILPAIGREQFPKIKVAVDLNAVPPHGLGGTKPTDADKDRTGVRVWGALGVGGLKMKIHKAAIRALFAGEPTVFEVDQVFELGQRVLNPQS